MAIVMSSIIKMILKTCMWCAWYVCVCVCEVCMCVCVCVWIGVWCVCCVWCVCVCVCVDSDGCCDVSVCVCAVMMCVIMMYVWRVCDADVCVWCIQEHTTDEIWGLLLALTPFNRTTYHMRFDRILSNRHTNVHIIKNWTKSHTKHTCKTHSLCCAYKSQHSSFVLCCVSFPETRTTHRLNGLLYIIPYYHCLSVTKPFSVNSHVFWNEITCCTKCVEWIYIQYSNKG